MDQSPIAPYDVNRDALHGRSVRFSITTSVNSPSFTVANGIGILSVPGDANRGVVEIATHDSKNPNRHITYRLTEPQAKKLEKNQRGNYTLVI